MVRGGSCGPIVVPSGRGTRAGPARPAPHVKAHVHRSDRKVERPAKLGRDGRLADSVRAKQGHRQARLAAAVRSFVSRRSAERLAAAPLSVPAGQRLLAPRAESDERAPESLSSVLDDPRHIPTAGRVGLEPCGQWPRQRPSLSKVCHAAERLGVALRDVASVQDAVQEQRPEAVFLREHRDVADACPSRQAFGGHTESISASGPKSMRVTTSSFGHASSVKS